MIQQIPIQNFKINKIGRIHIEVTNICNFNCNFCPANLSKRKKISMELSFFKKIIDEIAEAKITKFIDFHVLGEPLLYPKIFDAIKYAKHKGFNTNINTNGSLLDQKTVKNLIKSGLDTLRISIVSTREKDYLPRGSKTNYHDYFQRILTAIKLINESSSHMKIILQVWDTSDIRYFAADKDIRINGKKGEFKDSLFVLVKDILSVLSKEDHFEKIRTNLNKMNFNSVKNIWTNIWIDDKVAIVVSKFFDWGNSFTKKRVYLTKIGYCKYGNDSLGILSNGNVVICCIDYDGRVCLGNLHSRSLVSILTSKRTQEIRDGLKKSILLHPYCQRCFGAKSRFMVLIKILATTYIFKFRLRKEQRDIILY